jgi:hypothetical protein
MIIFLLMLDKENTCAKNDNTNIRSVSSTNLEDISSFIYGIMGAHGTKERYLYVAGICPKVSFGGASGISFTEIPGDGVPS